uniref:Helicase ATP-binding domain-containing protein n=1 Tax=Mesocestoides corti TaxID=53468 RepID=A0A5K3EZ52_MESCO
MGDFEDDIDDAQLIACLESNEVSMLTRPNSAPVFIAPKRTDFPGFPYPTPYPQQIDLMRFFYASLASSKCSIIESPTGTGKSTTLLASSLYWLLDHNQAVENHLSNLRNFLLREASQSTDEPDWIAAHSRRRAQRLQLNKEMEPLEASQKARTKASDIIKRANEVKILTEKPNPRHTKSVRERISLLPEAADMHLGKSADDLFLPETEVLSARHASDQLSPNIDENMEDCRVLQVIYCSRTHSQLAQVVGELMKMKDLSDKVTVVTLASRQMLCVNKAVYSLKNQALVREACLDLTCCKFRAKDDVDALSDYLLGTPLSAVEAASVIRGSEGTAIEEPPVHACPYYANKKGLPLAQLVLTPYQTVVVPGIRDATGLSLRNNVIIFDEAHNLLEAVAASFSAAISYTELLSAGRLISAFSDYYRSRLSAISVLRLRQLNLVIMGCANLLDGKSKGLRAQVRQRVETENQNSSDEVVYTVPDWLFVSGIDHINLSYLVEYLQKDRCVHKIAGFGKWFGGRNKKDVKKGTKAEENKSEFGLSLSDCLQKLKRPPTSSVQSLNATEQPAYKRLKSNETDNVPSSATLKGASPDLESSGPSLFALLSFLEALVKNDLGGDDDGRLIVKPTSPASQHQKQTSADQMAGCIRFIILNPGRYLYDVVKEARSVVLAGGTMKPFEEFTDQVFRPAGKSESDVTLFSCGHVIDAKRQLAIYAPSFSPGGVPWDFTFKNRNNSRLIHECGEFLIEVCKVVPGGVAVFFPSFDYLSAVWTHWNSTDLFSRLQMTKKVFKEPRSATALGQVMQAYAAAATSSRQGACIVCVIGGKLSEGINFNDSLARCVVVVGLPYPNIHSAAMREKLRFMNERFAKCQKDGRTVGQVFCEAMCMRAVNQTIGRAIRHARDYAAVFLLDQRFARRQLRDQLPTWAQDAITNPTPRLDQLRIHLEHFFQRNASSSR